MSCCCLSMLQFRASLCTVIDVFSQRLWRLLAEGRQRLLAATATLHTAVSTLILVQLPLPAVKRVQRVQKTEHASESYVAFAYDEDNPSTFGPVSEEFVQQ